MSSFLGLTPVLRIALRNPLLGKVYPLRGTALTVIDTGYDGFVAAPREVFLSLSLDQLSPTKRTVLTADGHPLEMDTSYATAEIPSLDRAFDGPIESAESLQELLVGTKFLRKFNLTLDYCAGTTKLDACR